MRVPRIDHRVQTNGSTRQAQDHGDLCIIALSRHYRTPTKEGLSNLNGGCDAQYYTIRHVGRGVLIRAAALVRAMQAEG